MRKQKKTKKITDFEVQFEGNGDLSVFNYSSYSIGGKTEPNKIFSDTLEYVGYFGSTGGNSHIKFKSINSGRKYHMFMSDFDDVLQAKRFINNQMVGLFTFCKKSNSQGMRLIFEDVP